MRLDRKRIHRWVRIAFIAWAVFSTSWLANTMRTRGVTDDLLRSTPTLTVVDGPEMLELRPAKTSGTALVFICGSGVAARAYLPLLRPVAEAGYPVFVIKLPWRFAPLQSHKSSALRRAHAAIASHREISRWVVAGHSLGAALTTRIVAGDPGAVDAIVLIGTTHPKEMNLSKLTIKVTKVYASNEGVAPPERVLANRHLLPGHAKYVEIRGGNHSQFGHYGHQLFDGDATISREAQQAMTRTTLLEALANASRARSRTAGSFVAHWRALP